MIYKEFQDIRLSSLGFGMMRLPGGCDNPQIDEAQTAEMIDYAIRNGVNYFDTAWGYHQGNSERVAGKLLSQYPRESYYLASKFPGYDVSNFGHVEEIFEEQLKKCRTDYFDFYLLHNIYEKNIDAYLDDEAYHTVSYLLEQKAKGRIRHLGFSAHGEYEVMERFLAAYGDKMEFCQIQLNYLDWHFQKADKKVELLNRHNIPIWVMEPLRGGRLATLPEDAASKLKSLRPEETVPGWAFRFLQSVPGVTMVLSGMSDLPQMKENIATFSEDKPLSEEELDALVGIADDMVRGGILPCTACRYCTSYCPQGLDIPRLLALYNEHTFTGGGFLAPMAVEALPEDKRPSACVGCRSCEAVCPQQIKISEAMAAFAKLLQ
ncbi:MAG: aldo/keto reductase [Faecousia sp.]